MLWLTALGKLTAGWLAAWLLSRAGLHLTLRLVGNSKDRRQVVRTTVQALMLFSWTAVAVWAWDTVPYEGIGDQIVYGLARLATVIVTIHVIHHMLIRLLANFCCISTAAAAPDTRSSRLSSRCFGSSSGLSDLSITCKALGNAGKPRFKPIIRRRKLNYVIDRAFSGSKGLILLLNGLHGF